jgi:aryl-alcohol dehydrogenase-like predicted oxidoreductase
MTPHATPEGTKRFAARFADSAPGFFREAHGLTLSGVGLGTYLGEADDATDRRYEAAAARAVALGANVLDTAVNYRFQRSERNVGAALKKLFSEGKAARDEILVCTKGGYVPFDGRQPQSREEYAGYIRETFVAPGVCRTEDIVEACHCMTPAYLRHQLETSLRNLGLACADVYYVHNPETQLAAVSRDAFHARLTEAFRELERAADEGKICFYGTATWNGYRAAPEARDYLSIESVVKCAEAAGGKGHRFRFVQLPFNAAMTEAAERKNQSVAGKKMTMFEAARALGVALVSSGSLLQGRLASAEAWRGAEDSLTPAQRGLAFNLAAEGLTAALAGMSRTEHVEENLALRTMA